MAFSFPTETITEGTADVVVPDLQVFGARGWGERSAKAPVFYNPRMSLSRDVAVLALLAHRAQVGRPLTVCEPMSGTGVRGIRFASHEYDVERVVLGDLNPESLRLIEYNLLRLGLVEKVSSSLSEANGLLSRYAQPEKRFDMVDLDPFGCPTPYMDSTVRSVTGGGLVAITATDMAPLCGVHPSACLRKYNAKPIRTEYCHELAVRIVVGSLVTAAARNDLGVGVVFSHSTDHYVRVYAKILRGRRWADRSVEKMGYVLHCCSCQDRTWRRGLVMDLDASCGKCGGPIMSAGPLWLSEISDSEFTSRMLDLARDEKLSEPARVGKLLTLSLEESGMPPAFFRTDRFCDILGSPTPKKSSVMRALRDVGFTVTNTHFSPQGFKTNATAEDVRTAIMQSRV